MDDIFNVLYNGIILPPNGLSIYYNNNVNIKKIHKEIININLGTDINILFITNQKCKYNSLKSFDIEKISKINPDIIIIDEILNYEIDNTIDKPIIAFTQSLQHFLNKEINNIPKQKSKIIYHITKKKPKGKDYIFVNSKTDFEDIELDKNICFEKNNNLILSKLILSNRDDMIDIYQYKKNTKDILEMYDIIYNDKIYDYKTTNKETNIKTYQNIIELINNNDFQFEIDIKDDLKEYLNIKDDDINDNIYIYLVKITKKLEKIYEEEKKYIEKCKDIKNKTLLDEIDIMINTQKDKKHQNKVIENYIGPKFISSEKKNEKVNDKIALIEDEIMYIFDIIGITPFSRKLKRKIWKEKENKEKNILFLSSNFITIKLDDFLRDMDYDKEIRQYKKFIYS